MQSIAGSTILARPVPQALIRGLKMNSESASEYSIEPPSLSGPGTEESDSESATAEDDGGDDFCGEFSRSITALHSLASLECFRHDAFLTIFSKAGVTTRLSRESASEEAIPNLHGELSDSTLDRSGTNRDEQPLQRIASELCVRSTGTIWVNESDSSRCKRKLQGTEQRGRWDETGNFRSRRRSLIFLPSKMKISLLHDQNTLQLTLDLEGQFVIWEKFKHQFRHFTSLRFWAGEWWSPGNSLLVPGLVYF